MSNRRLAVWFAGVVEAGALVGAAYGWVRFVDQIDRAHQEAYS